MANTSSRALRLLSLLETHRYWPGIELAQRLEVSARTLRRDVERLRELGYPVHAYRGVDGGYQLAAGAALPPLVVDDDEAVALALGLHSAAQDAVSDIAESSVRALAKVTRMMPARLRRRVETLRAVTVSASWGASGKPVDARILLTVAQACQDAERVEFGYTARAGERTERHVEPHRLVSLGRRWYLVAYDLTRHDWRRFRVDRLADARRTGVRFRPRELPATDAAEFVKEGIDETLAAYTVRVMLDAPVAEVRERIGRWCTAEEAADGRSLVRMTSDSLEWPVMALGVAGVSFEVLEPPELAEYVRDWGRRFTAAANAR